MPTFETSTQWVAALALVIAAAAHAVAVADHRDSLTAAAFFVGAVLVQLGTALAYVCRPGHRVRLVIAGTTSLLLGIWAASRTVGIAIGHSHGPEALAIVDGVAVVAEVVALVAVTAASRIGRWRQLSLAVVVSMAIAGAASVAASRPAVDHHTSDHSPTSPAVTPYHAPSSGHAPDPAVILPVGGATFAGVADAPREAENEHEACHQPDCEAHAHP